MTIQVREASVQTDRTDLAQWLAELGERFEAADQAVLSRALTLAVERYSGRSCPSGEPLLTHWSCGQAAASKPPAGPVSRQSSAEQTDQENQAFSL